MTIAAEGEELECAKGVLGPRKESGGAVDVWERLNRGRDSAVKAAEFTGGEGEADNIDVRRKLFRLRVDNNGIGRCNRQ